MRTILAKLSLEELDELIRVLLLILFGGGG